MNRPDTILLDVGGTAIKCSDGRSVPSCSGGEREEIIAALREAVGPTEGLRKLGVAIPGPFDYGQGTFLMKHKFAAVYGESFRTLAGIPDSVTIKYHHDVNAALQGAQRMLGLMKDNAALVTLGTGLGFSYAVKGIIQYAKNGSPARGLWDMQMLDGRILEDRISARGISATYARLSGINGLTPKEIADLAHQGDANAIETYRSTGAILGGALRVILGDMTLKVLLVGGGIAESLDLINAPLEQALDNVRIIRVPEGAVFKGLSSLFLK